MSGFDKFCCPTCRGTGILERARRVTGGSDDHCFILHRQYGLVKRCLRAPEYTRQCDQPYPGVPATRDGLCPIAAVEDQHRAEDAWIQAQVILRNCGRSGMDALRIEEGGEE